MSTAVIGAPEFRARNGIVVRPASNGGIEVGRPGYRDYTPPEATFALEEWFQFKRDAELGRWRDPLNPDYVVSRWGDNPEEVRVVHEPTARYEDFTRDKAVVSNWIPSSVAHRYFEAHPERKPWHDAQAGEVWVLSTADGECDAYAVITVRESGIVFESDEGRYLRDDTDIESARRIWPEDAS